jgi:formate hydrogenlyase subunit 6/NADH:ubiquinone oxidoreductase subunit I
MNSTRGKHDKGTQKLITYPEGKRQVDRTGRRRENNIKIYFGKCVFCIFHVIF